MKLDVSDYSENSMSSGDDDDVDDGDLENSQNSLDFLQSQQQSRSIFVSMDGIHSGVPTRTTATLTPTTLRNIEQTFFELTNDPPTTVPCQGGFVPPLPSFTFEPDNHDQNSFGSTESSSDSNYASPPPQSALMDEPIGTVTKNGTKRRNMGGRRPKLPSNLTPEEEEKRKVRRERNKLAAARCRKRRVDQTNDLVEKVTALESERSKLHLEIEGLQMQKNELEFCLEAHRTACTSQIPAIGSTSGVLGGSGNNNNNNMPTNARKHNNNNNNNNDINNINNNNNNNNNSSNNNNINFKPPLSVFSTTNNTKSVNLGGIPMNIIQSSAPSTVSTSLSTTSSNISASIPNSSLNSDKIKVEIYDPEIDGPPPLKKQFLLTKANPIMSLGASPLTPQHTLPSLTISSSSSSSSALTNSSQSATTPNTPQFLTSMRPNRPSSLNVPHMMTPSQALSMHRNISDIAGVQITTPSTCVVFNFDSLMDGGTGLTPVSQPLMPNCSSQNKNPLDLATPTSEPSKLVSL